MTVYTEFESFVRENNRIERIIRDPLPHEVEETRKFVFLPRTPTVEDMITLVSVYQPGAVLREQKGLNVRVGNYIAPSGGPEIRTMLDEILIDSNYGDPYDIHCRYELLHPFTDGNGRSGRSLWLWMMYRTYKILPPLGFLHTWYYQSLSKEEKRRS